MTAAAPIQTCFKGSDPALPLLRRAAAERIGTMLLVLAASAGGVAAVRSVPDQPGAVAFMIATTVAGVLVALTVAFGRLSGRHNRPPITGQQFRAGGRSLFRTVTYVLARMLGGIVAAAAAAVLWHASPGSVGGLGRSGFTSEFVASARPILIVIGSSGSGNASSGPFAAGTWLLRAVPATPTASHAGTAVVVGAHATAGLLKIGIGSAVPYGSAEIAGALTALLAVSVIYSRKQVMG